MREEVVCIFAIVSVFLQQARRSALGSQPIRAICVKEEKIVY